jgi:predicted DNA-binding protein (MmcQ/YjbR family)
MDTYEFIEQQALQLPGVTQEQKFDLYIAYCVLGKIFIIMDPNNPSITASFRVNENDFDDYLAQFIHCKQAPYFAKGKWILTEDINNFSNAKWKEIIKTSYTLIASKLTKKEQKQLGL